MANLSQVKTQFDGILEAAKARRGDSAVDTMIVSSHLAQMRMFMLRRGVEFFADQDSFGMRKDFINQVCENNMLEMKLESIVDYFLCDGQGLFYFRPSGDDYQLFYFPKDSYRAFRGQDGNLESVELIYSFNVRETSNIDSYANPNSRGGKKKYIRLKVFKDKIEQTVSNEKIDFENQMGNPIMTMPGATETFTNSLGFIPAVEVYNYMDCTGEATGNGEFDWLSNQILYHDELVRNIRKNMKFFGNPTLVSSRPKHDLIESGEENSFRPTISSMAGFFSPDRPSTRSTAPFGGPSPIDGQIKVPRVIANLEPTDRVNYMTPDSVSGDQNMYVKQYRSEIRLALGGVDDIDIGTASTAYEIKTLYGRVAATAEKKARAIFTYGLCKIFAMMIKHEEYLFEESFAQAVGLTKPSLPLEEDFGPDQQEALAASQEAYNLAMQKFVRVRSESIRDRIEQGMIPDGVVGLIPDGSTKVAWRWQGQVFEESTDDILNNSIVVRNLQELGVDSIEALKYLFPNKTDEERAAMLSGYPFRMVQQTQQSLSAFIGLLGNLYQLPHPQTPELPLASDPNLDITGFLYRSLEFLRKELSYSGSYKPGSNDSGNNTLSDADRIRSQLGRPIRDEPKLSIPGIGGDSATGGSTSPGLPAGSGPAGFGGSGQPMAGGVPGAKRKPEYQQSLPGPGSVLGVPDTNTSSQYPGTLGFNGAGSAGTNPSMGQPGSADLQSPSFNPGLLRGRGGPAGKPGAAAGRKPVPAAGGKSGQRRVSKPSQRRKS
tara:strand:+ start:4610 stop:6925 length:2316 start_codon:yes stop_codon:yes gene_type:complete